MLRLILFTLLLNGILGAKILAFFPFPGKSHHNVFRPIMEGLASKGHEVTYLGPFPFKNPNRNIKEIIIPNYLIPVIQKLDFMLLDMKSNSIPSTVLQSHKMGYLFGEVAYGSKEVQALIHSNEKFDAVLTQTFLIQEALSALAHKFNALSIEIMPLGDCAWVNEFAGLPDNPSYQIDFNTIYTDKMNFFERLKNTYVKWITYAVSYYYMTHSQGLVDKYFNYTGSETRPSITKLMSDKALILVNSHHSVGYPYPKAPHVKEVGGVHITEGSPLPKDLQKFLDDAKNGAVYVSMGSNINISLPKTIDIRNAFLNSFKNLKQQVLFKWDSDILPEVSANVKMSKWFPQQDILAHKNLKVFVSHGGFLSISESVHYGVPVVGIPFFGDQPKNLKQVTSAGYGVEITLDNLTETSLTWAINEIANNPSYAKEAKRRSLLFRDRPMKPREEAVYWIEYVLKHGKALQPRSVHLNFFQLHMWDVIGFLILISYLMYSILCKLICRKRVKNISLQKKKN